LERRDRSRLLFCFALAGAVALAPPSALAQRTDHLRRELAGVGVDEKLGARLPLDLELLDESGRTVSLRRWRGRPMLLSLNYTSCPMLCSLQLAGLAKALAELGGRAGRGFQIVTISIDPRDRPSQLARFDRVYVGQAGGSRDLAARWHFLAGAEERIRAIADAVGFRYRFDPETRQFRHKATLVVIDTEGRVSSYLHGILYEPDVLAGALARAARGEVAGAEEQATLGGFLLNCFAFDSEDHAPLALTVMRSGGLLAILFLAGFMGRQFVREHRARKP
jgi:protein SCO1/2